MKNWLLIPIALAIALGYSTRTSGALPTDQEPLPNFDKRTALISTTGPSATAAAQQTVGVLKSRVQHLTVTPDPVLGSGGFVSATKGFLTGPNGQGLGLNPAFLNALPADDPHRIIKAFLNEHAELFGHDSSALASANVTRDYVTKHNGLRTIVWEQTQDNIPVFESLLVGHITAVGELISLSDHFVPDPAKAAQTGTRNRSAMLAQPPVSAAGAISRAAANVGGNIEENSISFAGLSEGPERSQTAKAAGLMGPAWAQMVWFPLSPNSMRLAWRVIFNAQPTPYRYLSLVDVETGELLLRYSLNAHLTPATYNVYTSDSPSPFSPGWSFPTNGQPALTNRVKVTLSALDTNASPQGWIPDNGTTTTGNNTDTFLDRNLDFQPDIPRPPAGPNRTFDFPLDLTRDPRAYENASTVQLFYRCNWYHDRLYQLGFTEAAGNYQQSNLGRGGLDKDAIICLVQAGADVGYTDNAMFQSAPDGFPGTCFMFIFSFPRPNRDGSLDQEVVMHELTHGTSNRLLGHGTLITKLQPEGMGEGWSDWYAMSLLSEPADDPDAVYATGGYVTYLLAGIDQNYYYGIRRYPYTTDMQKNPLTFKDIDPSQASPHYGIPTSPVFGGGPADEVHDMGEVWCVTLWEMRASLVKKLGWTAGNELALQLVTDGLKLAPANATFLEARDGVIQADQVDTGGADYNEIWIAFAKRGMGYSARVPGSDTTIGLTEAFDVPPDVVTTFPDGILEIKFTPPPLSAIFAGDTNSVFIRVTDSLGVTNATIVAKTNGVNLPFRNDGIAPDAFPLDSTYSASMRVPTGPTSITIDCVISAPGKDTSTNSVTYFIVGPPVNDNFTNAVKVPGTGGSYLTSNRRATLEDGEPQHAGDGAVTASLWWNFSPALSGPLLVDSGGSDFTSVVAVYTNSILTNLQAVASGIGGTDRKGAFVIFDAKQGQNYHIAVAGASSEQVGTVRFTVVPNGQPDTNAPVVTVTSPPTGLVVTSNRLTLAGTAVDGGPNASGIKDITISVGNLPAEESTITITPAPSADGPLNTNWFATIGVLPGLNIVRVSATDFAGNRSAFVSIQISYRPVDPINDFFVNGIVLTNTSGVSSVNTRNATKEVGEPSHAGNPGGKSAWWTFTAPDDGLLSLSTTNSTFDTLLGLYTGDRVTNLVTIASNDDASTGITGGTSFLTQAVKSNVTYHIAVDGYDGAFGAVFLTYAFTPAPVYHLDISSSSGGIVLPASMDVASNATVVLTAYPNPHYQFDKWDGDVVSIANPLSVVVQSNMTLTAQFRPFVFTDDFESGGLTQLAWTTAGDKPWIVQTNQVAFGQFAAGSGPITDGQSSSLLLSTVFQPGAASFEFKVSSEPGWDFLKFFVDGSLLQQWSGEVGWTTYTFPVTAGSHTLEWRYVKDPSGGAGLDAAFIDDLSLPLTLGTNSQTAAHLQLERQTDGAIFLDILGQTNQTYITQGSTNLVNWLNLTTNIANGGFIRIPDPAQGANKIQFYRSYAPVP